MGVAVIVAIAMIMVVVVMTFARKEDRQEEHQAADEGRRPSVTLTVVSEVWLEGHVAG